MTYFYFYSKLVVSNKVHFGEKGFKCFIGNIYAKKVRALYIFLSRMSTYRKDFDETRNISFLIKDDELLKK